MSAPLAKVLRLGDQAAEIELGLEIAERSGLKPGEELFVFAPGANVMLLARAGGRDGFLLGSLSTVSIGEVLGFITSGIRSGTLILQGPTARRRLTFEDGQVVFASSTELSERLGPVLWRNGLLAREQLEACEPKVAPGLRLGQILIESGFLSPARLYRGMQLQVREIVLGAFTESEGEFAFIESDGELNSVKMFERTRDLILAGMNRGQEMALLRESFPAASVPARTGTGGPQGLEQTAAFERVDGVRSVRDIVRTSRLGDFAALKALSELARAGAIKPGEIPPAASKRPAAAARLPIASVGSGPLALYQTAIKRITEELGGAGALARLGSFSECLSESHAAAFSGIDLTRGGALDLEGVVANAQRLHRGAMGRAIALEALDAFVSFALFDARNVLPPAKAGELSREVLKILRGR